MIVGLIVVIVAVFAVRKFIIKPRQDDETSSSQSESLTDIYDVNASEAKAVEELIQEYIDAHKTIANDCIMRNIDNVVGVKVYASDRYIVTEQIVDIDAERIDAYRWVFDNAVNNNKLPDSLYAVLKDVMEYTGNDDVKISLQARTSSGTFIYENGVGLPAGYEVPITEPASEIPKCETLLDLFDTGALQELGDIENVIVSYKISYVDESTLKYTMTYLQDLSEDKIEDISVGYKDGSPARRDQYDSFVSLIREHTDIESVSVIFETLDNTGRVLGTETISDSADAE